MQLVGVQAPVTHQFSREQQHGNLVAIANPCCRVSIDIEHIDAVGLHSRQRMKLGEHFLAQAATRA